MERLETKQINGHTYYYYSKWARVKGKPRRVWQRYLGKLEDIVQAVEGGGPVPRYAEVFQWGLPLALWRECEEAGVVAQVDQCCPKRNQGLSTGEYLALAAVNRAMCPTSKRTMWEWFSHTVLMRYLPAASKAALASPRFWDHMDRLDAKMAAAIWQRMLHGVVRREGINLSAISYDGTNFYTFIDTFNSRCELAKRGKNKQGRHDLRQISYALFCSADGQLPLFYEVYEGNRHDAKQFPLMVQRFGRFLRELSGGDGRAPDTTLVFDKGNNSEANFTWLDTLDLHFVGSVKLDEHKDLATVVNTDARFVPCTAADLEGTKAFRVKRSVYGQERLLVVTYNQHLFDSQWLTLQTDLAKALEKLAGLSQKLADRVNGVLTRGKAPTLASIEKQCETILSRPYLKRLIPTTITAGTDGIPRLLSAVDAKVLAQLAETYLGKTILITNRENWTDEQIIQAYRSQFLIEEVFKEMKDRHTGSWWPLYHWTDSKLQVHGLYCTIAVLLRALLQRRLRQAGVHLSLKRTLVELDAIRAVVNVYPPKRHQQTYRRQIVLTKTSKLQQQLMDILHLTPDQSDFRVTPPAI